MTMTKICKKCGKEKDLLMFAKYRYKNNLLHKATCRECNKPARKIYYTNHVEEIIIKVSNYRKKNRSKINEQNRKRRECDLGYRLYDSVRSVIKTSIKRSGGRKNRLSSLKYLPYTIQQLKDHLEKQFKPWMSWQNWGRYNSNTWNDNDPSTWTWQIDHIIPQSDLPYTSMEEENFNKCWSLQNLRPLSAKQNIIDGPTKIRHINKAI
jgi:hypothetical protein